METTQSPEIQTQKKLPLSRSLSLSLSLYIYIYIIYVRFLNAPEGLESDQVKVQDSFEEKLKAYNVVFLFFSSYIFS